MSRTYKTSSDVGGSSKQIEKAGTYHCAVLSCADGATTKGNPMNGCSAVLNVLDGTESDQKEKEFHLHLFDPDGARSEGGAKAAMAKLTAYGIAVNQFDPAKLGEDQAADFGAVEGQQLIVTLDWNEYDGKRNLQVAYANIYHVDDPRAAKFPKDKEGLALIDKEHRKPGSYFEPLLKQESGKNGSGDKVPKTRLSSEELASL